MTTNGELLDKLNTLLLDAEAKIVALNFGIPGDVPLRDGWLLGFGKLNYAWHLVAVRNDVVQLLTSAPSHVRIEAASLLDALEDELQRNMVAQTSALEEAIEDVKDYLTVGATE